MTTHKKRFKTIITVVTFFALVGAVYALRHQISETITHLRKANPWPVLLIFPLAMLNHFAQGKLYQGLFRILGERFRTKSMMRLSLELNFVNNIFPSAGVSGFSYLSIRMRSENISAAKATLVQIMRFALLFVSFQILLGSGLIMLAIGNNANDFVLLVSGSLATLLLVGTAVVVYVIGSKTRINTFFTGLTIFINRFIQIFRPRHPETINISRLRDVLTELHLNYKHVRSNLVALKHPLLFALLANLAEIVAIIMVFLAFGHFVNPGAVIIAYAVANFAGLISVLPGGVGIYEALMAGVFAASGVPPGLSLPVILAFRVLSISVQIPIGYFFYQKALRDERVTPESVVNKSL